MRNEIHLAIQYGLLEFIAHVISEDYEAMPRDFVNLGFSPPSKIDQLEGSGLTEGELTLHLQYAQKLNTHKTRNMALLSTNSTRKVESYVICMD